GKDNEHSELFIPTLEKMLKNQNLSVSGIDRYLAPLGPGSFTGLRIAFASLKAFFMVRPVPVETLNGAECRLLSYLSNQSGDFKTASVVSYATYDKFVLSYFVRSNDEWFPEGEKVVQGKEIPGEDGILLLDDRCENLIAPQKATTNTYPLRAHH